MSLTYGLNYKKLKNQALAGKGYEESKANREAYEAMTSSLVSDVRARRDKTIQQISSPKADEQARIQEGLTERFNPVFVGGDTEVASLDEDKVFKSVTNSNGESIGKRLMGDISEALGITDEQTAGIVGNLDHETGGFKYLQELNPVVPGSKGGRGFAMWTGPRRKAFETWSKTNKLDPDSYEASFGFFIEEVKETSEGRFLKNLEKTNTAEEAAKVFSKEYLRPGKPLMSRRIAKANYYAGGE
jgi:hypothetical protein